MKNSTLKSIFFSFIAAFLMVSMISCQQEQVQELTPEPVSETDLVTTSSTEFKGKIMLPAGFDYESEEQMSAYLKDLELEDMKFLEENFRITMFLEKEGLWETVSASLNAGDVVAALDYEKLLAPAQLRSLNKFEVEENDFRAEWCSDQCNYGHQSCSGSPCPRHTNYRYRLCNFNGHYYYDYCGFFCS